MASLGFQRSSSEHGVYTRTRGESRLIVGVYVDDLVITGYGNKDILLFKDEMKSIFKMSDLGLLSYYLGIEVSQGPGGINLCQAAYAEKFLERNGLLGCNPTATPMEPRLKMGRESSTPEVNATEYRRIIGGLRYLIHTRPDLAFSVGFLSRFMEKPHEEHLVAVKRILRYVAGTHDHGLCYTRGDGEPAKLIGYSDADLAGDIDQRKSTTGIVFFSAAIPSPGSPPSRRSWRSPPARQSTSRRPTQLARASGLLGCWATSPAQKLQRQSSRWTTCPPSHSVRIPFTMTAPNT
jgi:hypothetical protein